MQFKKTVLSNGLKVITVPMPDNPSVTVLALVEAGSKYETKETSGISHFIEHILFKGTPRRTKPTDISREFESIGAQHNAFTGQEFTGYYAKADASHFAKILDLLSDMYVHPLFDEKEMNKEKGVIVEEIRMYQDIPQKRVADLFMELMYGDQPVGWNIAGTEQTVRSFTREQVLKYRKEHYRTGATTIVVAGSFDEKKVVKDIEKAFSGLSKGETKPKLKVKESQKDPKIQTTTKETDQTHLIIGFRTFPINDKRIPAMSVLSGVLGKGMSSRLFTKMREELGICYYIKTDHEPFTDHGVLAISAGLDNSRVHEGVKGILAECRRLKDELVPEAEIQKVKDYLAGTTLLELETSDARAEFAGFQEILKKKIHSPQEMIEKVRKVTAADVRKLARQIFVSDGMNLALIGKSADAASLQDIFVL